jgi:hypothetical protein
VTERISLLLILYGPSAIGLLILLGVCLIGRTARALAWGSGISILFHLATFAFLFALAGIGSWGNSAAFDFPWKVLFYGLAATAVLTLAKAIHLGLLRRR